VSRAGRGGPWEHRKTRLTITKLTTYRGGQMEERGGRCLRRRHAEAEEASGTEPLGVGRAGGAQLRTVQTPHSPS